MPPELWGRLVDQIIEAKSVNARLLEFVAPFLPASECRRAFSKISQIEDEDDTAWLIWALAPVLELSEIDAAFVLLEKIGAAATTYRDSRTVSPNWATGSRPSRMLNGT